MVINQVFYLKDAVQQLLDQGYTLQDIGYIYGDVHSANVRQHADRGAIIVDGEMYVKLRVPTRNFRLIDCKQVVAHYKQPTRPVQDVLKELNANRYINEDATDCLNSMYASRQLSYCDYINVRNALSRYANFVAYGLGDYTGSSANLRTAIQSVNLAGRDYSLEAVLNEIYGDWLNRPTTMTQFQQLLEKCEHDV